jgi:ApbE superfamily uncharacterized protein (UPF0280 family)
LYTFTKNSTYPTAQYIRYCEILRKIIKEATLVLIAESNNKIKTTWNIKKKKQEKYIKQVPTLLVTNEKLRIQETWPLPSIIYLNYYSKIKHSNK